MGRPIPDALYLPLTERALRSITKDPEGIAFLRALGRLLQDIYSDMAHGINQNWADRNTPSPTGLTPQRQMATDAAGTPVASNLSSYVTGTARRVTAADDGSGGVTLSGPQDLDTDDAPTFAGVTLSGLTASRLAATDGAKGVASVSDLTAWISGTANQVTVTDNADGTLTLSTPQDIGTGSSPTFAGATINGDITITGTVDGVDLSGLGATYAPIANGVTNGDSHDHSGGDGAQIDHTGLSNIGTNTHAQIDTHIGTTAGNPHSVTAADIGVEAGADVTDEANVTGALDGATLADVGTPASTDRVLLQDADASGELKTADFSEFGASVPASNCCIEVGEYTGDGGTNKQVSLTASWDPIFVVVREKSTSLGSSTAGIYMTDGATYAAYFSSATARDRLRLGTASFYVDDDGGNNDPNASGVDYVYMALGIATS